MQWLHPDSLWALLAVPAVLALVVWAAWQRRRLLARFGEHRLVRQLMQHVRPRARRWKAGLMVVGVGLLALALAGPRYGTQLRTVEREGVDLIVALDVSLSMQAEDVAPSRLARAKREIKELLGQLSGDRVGLVLFAGDAFLQCPLTTDYSAVRLFLDVASPEMLATPGTDFRAAYRTARQAFRTPLSEEDSGDRSRVVLFVSDGEDHTEGIAQLRRRAEEDGVVLYAAGVGEMDGAPIPITSPAGRPLGFKRDAQGDIVQTRLEEAALRELSEDGGYYRIARTGSTLPDLRGDLASLDRTSLAEDTFESYEERFQWPLALALLLLVVELALPDRRRAAR